MLCGCTEGDAADLLPLAKSWLRAPEMTLDGKAVPYDVTQRAYILPASASASLPSSSPSFPAEAGNLSLRLSASPSHPANGLCLILPGVDAIPQAVKVNGSPLPGFKAGIHTAWDGPSLILWLPVTAFSPLDISVSNTVLHS